jgi:hypothetical protein
MSIALYMDEHIHIDTPPKNSKKPGFFCNIVSGCIEMI